MSMLVLTDSLPYASQVLETWTVCKRKKFYMLFLDISTSQTTLTILGKRCDLFNTGTDRLWLNVFHAFRKVGTHFLKNWSTGLTVTPEFTPEMLTFLSYHLWSQRCTVSECPYDHSLELCFHLQGNFMILRKLKKCLEALSNARKFNELNERSKKI